MSCPAFSVRLSGKQVVSEAQKLKNLKLGNETPEERKARLVAKTINFSCTIFARVVIIVCASYFAYNEYIESGGAAVRPFLGIALLCADLGHVIVKTMTPGTK